MAKASTPSTSTLRVRDELRHAIVEGILEPGERLGAEALAQRFGTSRTPVREALVLLEHEGLVDLHPHRGGVVRAFDSGDVLDLYEVRALIEPEAAARAAVRIDEETLARLEATCAREEALVGDAPDVVDEHIALNEEFHRLVVGAAGSPRLAAAMRAATGIPRAFRTTFWSSEDQRRQSLFCHRQLVAALRAGRPDLAEAIMRMHILGAKEFLMDVSEEDDGRP